MSNNIFLSDGKMAQEQLSHFNSIEADKKFRAVDVQKTKQLK